MSADRPSLRDLHAHVCSESGDGPLLCDADESDEHEAGVCSAWDAIRDAYSAAVRDERAAIAAWLRSDETSRRARGGGLPSPRAAGDAIEAGEHHAPDDVHHAHCDYLDPDRAADCTCGLDVATKEPAR